MRYNFQKQKASNIDSMSVPYDYRSIMHYGRTAFGRGKLTIETRDPKMQRVIGRRSGFSDYDVLQMNLLYKCPGIFVLFQTLCSLGVVLFIVYFSCLVIHNLKHTQTQNLGLSNLFA